MSLVRLQTYPNIESLIQWGEKENVGTKRNKAIASCKGDIIVHFDSDDLYAPDWVSQSVRALGENGAAMVGLNQAYFYDFINKSTFDYAGPENFLLGATLCYHREYWEKNKFRDIPVGEDYYFTTECKNKDTHFYREGFLASIHDSNTSKRDTNANNFRHISDPKCVSEHLSRQQSLPPSGLA